MIYEPENDGSMQDAAANDAAPICSPKLRDARPPRTEAQARADHADDEAILAIIAEIGRASREAHERQDDASSGMSERGRLACQDAIDTLAQLRVRLVVARGPAP